MLPQFFKVLDRALKKIPRVTLGLFTYTHMCSYIHSNMYTHTPRAHEKKNKQMNKKLVNFPKFTGLVGTTVRLWMTAAPEKGWEH